MRLPSAVRRSRRGSSAPARRARLHGQRARPVAAPHELAAVAAEHLAAEIAGRRLELPVPGQDAPRARRAPITKAGIDSTSSRWRRSERSSSTRRRSRSRRSAGLLERAPDRVEEVGRRDRLEHVGEGRDAHGRDRALDGGVARHHDRLHERRARAQRRQQRQAVAVGQAHVDERDVEVALGRERERRATIARDGRLDAERLRRSPPCSRRARRRRRR